MVISFLFFLAVSTAICENRLSNEVDRFANKAMFGVINTDIEQLLKMISKHGVYFGDSKFSKNEISRLLKDKNSLLYKHMFAADDSVKAYFDKNKNISLVVLNRGSKSAIVKYRSDTLNEDEWLECCFIKIDNKWYFDGMFYCE